MSPDASSAQPDTAPSLRALPWWQVLEEELAQHHSEALESESREFLASLEPALTDLRTHLHEEPLAKELGPRQRLHLAFSTIDRAEQRLAVAEKDNAKGRKTLPDLEVLRSALQSLKGNRDAKQRWLEKLLQVCHKHPRSALCFSGGGIRSATFGLGVLQSLAKARALKRFHYLSTVSGGGFLGGWFSAWIRRVREEKQCTPEEALVCVEQDLARHAPKWTGAAPPYAHGPEPQPESLKVWRLRANSNYLAPRLGFFSADVWTLVALMLRNLMAHWLVLVPLVAAGLLLPRLALGALVQTHAPEWPLPVGFIALCSAFMFAQDARAHRADPKKAGAPPGLAPFLACAGSLLLARGLSTIQPAPSQTLNAHPQPWGLNWLSLAALVLAGIFVVALWRWNRRISLKGVWISLGACLAGGVILSLVLWKAHQLPGSVDANLPWSVAAAWGALVGILIFYLVLPLLVTLALREERESMAMGALMSLLLGLGLLLSVRAISRGGFLLTPSGWIALGPLLIALGIFILSQLLVSLRSDRDRSQNRFALSTLDREWYARLSAWTLIVGVGWGALSCLSLYGVKWAARLPAFYAAVTTSGFAAALWGVLSSSGRGEDAQGSRGWFLTHAAPLGGAVFALLIPLLLLAASDQALCLAWGLPQEALSESCTVHLMLDSAAKDPPTNGVAENPLPPSASTPDVFKRIEAKDEAVLAALAPRPPQTDISKLKWFGITTLALAVFGILLSLQFPLQELSLHSLYRNRLVRTYLGASQEPRHADPFTGFSDADDLPLKNLADQRPLFVVNAAMNQTFGEKLGWQERKASSFTLSPLHCGSFFQVGYQSTPGGYAGPISLGTAVAISGAAANPNMGYHSSPTLAFIMTFMSVRLGQWLPNPGPAGRKAWRRGVPVFALGPLFRDLFGFSNARGRYVNLSDGGHFENLGLYEMVARRCALIVVSDGGEDAECQYEDLGNAIKKIRIDLGIPITLSSSLPRARGASADVWQATPSILLGEIHYEEVDAEAEPGKLIYIKPQLWKDGNADLPLPADILTYALAHPSFPHQGTGNQFFSESQFESYRALGAVLGELAAKHL